MTILDTLTQWVGHRGGESAGAARVGPTPIAAQLEAVSVLLTGRRGHHEAAREFTATIAQGGMDLSGLWSASEDEAGLRVTAAAVLLPSPGRSAMLLMSPMKGRGGGRDCEATRAALAAGCAGAADPAGVAVVQALLERGAAGEARVLRGAGFTDLADLLFMERDLRPAARKESVGLPNVGAGLTVVMWAEERAGLFARGIEASYEGTLDCPGLLGMRPIEDVMAGHRGSGEFEPHRWVCVVDEKGEDEGGAVAVLLVSRIPQRRAHELVYLGIVPAWRGRGLGRTLVEHAAAVAGAERSRTLLLAVDAANGPACRLYRKHGFRSTARKHAMVRAVGEGAEGLRGEGRGRD